MNAVQEPWRSINKNFFTMLSKLTQKEREKLEKDLIEILYEK